MGPLVAVLFLVLIALLAYLAHKAEQKRRGEMARWAAQHGLTFSRRDPFDLDDLDFELFSRGDGRGCENVMSGVWHGLDLKAADYWYYDERRDDDGSTSRTYRHFSVVVVSIDTWLPKLAVTKENALSRLADRVGLRDIELESEEFNRQFTVKADDREFAFKLLDPPMMQWLLATAGSHCYEVSGNRVLAYSGLAPTSDLSNLFYAVKGFLDHVPRLVWADYARRAS